MHVFLSHNHRDKTLVVPLATQLRLMGADVWLDDWEIRAGDSIPGKVNEALSVIDTAVIVWSEHAAVSRWVDAELATSLERHLGDGSVAGAALMSCHNARRAVTRLPRCGAVPAPSRVMRGVSGRSTGDANPARPVR
jgi:TIR domain-containing protein